MTVRALDPITGDINTRGMQFIDKSAEVAQTVKTRLHLFLGEYFRDITVGTPWFQEILGKGTGMTLSGKEGRIKEIILQTPGVVKLLTFNADDFDINSRELKITGKILTTFGEASLNVGSPIDG